MNPWSNNTGGKLGNTTKNDAPIQRSTPSPQPKKKEPSATARLGSRLSGTAKQFLQESRNITAPTPDKISAQTVRPDRVVTSGIQAANLGQVEGMRDMRGAVNAAAGNVARAGQMDPQTAAYLRAAQQQGQYSPEAISMMQAAASGQGPSAAQAQMQAGTDQAIRAQMAMAGSRGFNPAALRGAQMQGAEMLQTSANQAAQLRAQEQQAAQQQFLAAALQQEQMQRQAALQGAGLTLEQDIASQQARQAAINAQAAAAGQYAGLGMEQAQANAQLAQQAALANQDAFLRANLANQQAGLQAGLANQQTGLQAAMFNAGAGLDAFQAQNAARLGWAGLGADLQTAQFQGVAGAEQAALNRSFQARQNRADRRTQITGAVIGALGGGLAAVANRKS